MKRPGVDGDFLLCVGLNLAFSLYGALPAALLLVAHLVAGTPLWWAGTALLAWVVIVVVRTYALSALVKWADDRRPSSPSPSDRNAYEADLRERSRNMEQNQQERLRGSR